MRLPRTGIVSSTLAGGLAAGTLDILAAFAVYGLRGVSPVRILQSVSSGLLGRAAFEGGTATATLGLALHFFIATSAALAYVLASGRLAVLTKRPLGCGAAYGVAVYLVMNFVVIPLSAVSRGPLRPGLAAVILLVHVLFVGIPIALAARRYAATAESGRRRTGWERP